MKYVEDRVTHIVNNDHCGSIASTTAELAFDDDGTLPGAPDRLRRRLRRVSPVRHGHARERAVADRRAVPDPARRVLARRRADEQEPAGRLPRLRRGGARTGCSSGSSTWRRAELGLDRVEIRRRNLIGPDEFPYRTPTGNIYDSGNYQGVLEKILELVRLRPLGRRARQGACRGPPRRHRRRRVAGAKRLQLDGVLVLVRRPAVHADVEPRERERADRPDGADRRHAALAVRCGATARRRSSRMVVAEEFDVDPVVDRGHLRRLAACAARERARAAPATP